MLFTSLDVHARETITRRHHEAEHDAAHRDALRAARSGRLTTLLRHWLDHG
jgi:hypothetical protein